MAACYLRYICFVHAVAASVFLICLLVLAFSWVWWFKTGRNQPGKRTGRAMAALIYNTFLPVLLAATLPKCSAPRSEALFGLPFAVIGFVLAWMGPQKLRPVLLAYVLASYLSYAATIEPPRHRDVSKPYQTCMADQTETDPRS